MATLYALAGAALPLSRIVLLAALSLALYHVHRSLVVAPWALLFCVWWIIVLPCILLPVFGAETFFATEDSFYLVKLYSLVAPITLAGWYKMQSAYDDLAAPSASSSWTDKLAYRFPRIPAGAHLSEPWAGFLLCLFFLANIMEATVWEVARVGQTWYHWVNCVSGILLCLAVVAQYARWGVAVHVRHIIETELVASSRRTLLAKGVGGAVITAMRTEAHFHIRLTHAFVLAYSVWNFEYAATFAPDHWLLHFCAALLMPYVAAAAHPEVSWVELRAHALLGVILLIKFPGVGLAEALRVPELVHSEAFHGVFAVAGLVMSIWCCMDLAGWVRGPAVPWRMVVAAQEERGRVVGGE